MKNIISKSALKMIGIEKEHSYDVTKKDIKRFAQAINDSNPLYCDDDFAKKTKYKSIVAPPLFGQTFAFEDIPLDKLPPDGSPVEIDMPILAQKTVGGGSVYEIYKKIRPGDQIIVKTKLIDIYKKHGKSGLLYFIILETKFINHCNEIIAKETATFIKRV